MLIGEGFKDARETMIGLIKSLSESFLHLAFPSLCLHCQVTTEVAGSIFCHSCVQQLELLDPTEHCPYCFSAFYDRDAVDCAACRQKALFLHHRAAAFPYEGPAASLIKALKYGGQIYLATGMAAYLSAQFIRLGWPVPDGIVPVPIAFNHWLTRGFNQSRLLAEAVGKMIGCPVRPLLSRKSGDYSQAGLNYQQRMTLDGGRIFLKNEQGLQGATWLILDDVMTTGSTLDACAKALLKGKPKALYGLTFCQAIV